MLFLRATRKARQVSMTSLIDIVFLLMIFFMLSTTFSSLESMELSLPGVKAKKVAASPNVLPVYVYDAGKIYFDGKAMNEDEAFDALQVRFSKSSNARVNIYSASKISVQTLVSAMDLVYLAGGQQISLASGEPPEAVRTAP